MKKTIGIVILLVLILVSAGAQTLLDKPVATINLVKPEMVSQRQLNRQHSQVEAIRMQGGVNGASVDKRQVLELMISEILMNQGMERDGVTVSQQEIDEAVAQQKAAVEQQNSIALTDAQFRTAIEQQMQLPWESYIEQVTLQLKQQKYLLQKKADVLAQGENPPSYQEIDSFYRKNKSQFTNPDVLRFSHIFVSTENLSGGEKQQALERAEEAYRKLQNGSTFDALVVEYSDDNRSRYKGGDAGFLAINDPRPAQVFGQQFVDTLFSMNPGDTSRVLTSLRGYHIVKLTEYHDAKILGLTDTVTPDSRITVQEYIAQGLMNQNRQTVLEEALNELVQDLRNEAEITIFEENIE